MKLIICRHCFDVVKGDIDTDRTCKCGDSGVRYLNRLDAVYWGEATPLGFANSTLADALLDQPEEGLGRQFTAFVIPIKCPTFKKIEAPNVKV